MKAVLEQEERDPFLNFENPRLWKFNRHLYPELTDEEVAWMDSLPYDWGDIMAYVKSFLTKEQIASALATCYRDINDYVLKITGKEWNLVYDILWWKAQVECREEIGRLAKEGHATALSLYGHLIAKLDREEQSKALTVKIVNDLDED